MKDKLTPSTQLKDRVVRVFVSSTFRDMYAERDELAKFTFMELRHRCRERQVELVEVDLRWGITDEQASEGKVLPICLAEIQRTRPYFIGMLGERYGWVPDEIPPALIEQEPWLRDMLEEAMELHNEEEHICRELGNKDDLSGSLCNQAVILKSCRPPERRSRADLCVRTNNENAISHFFL